ncbi:MAG: hypothetical protein A2X49_01970 [Lentisphaerae bacterium GWF2_52_8]|nr:MAG: hypothetical protein A2X49_01970 [Lentisphaerae bacterium GWF2_52_8]
MPFTLVELLVVIGMIMLLFAMLLPALKTAKDRGLQVSCKNNLKQVYTGMQFYANDYSDYYPDYYPNWFIYLDPSYLKKSNVYKCPAFSAWKWDSNNIGYGINAYPWKAAAPNWIRPIPGRKRSTISKPSLLIMFVDTDSGFWHAGVNVQDLPPSRRHFGGANVSWCDGHVDWALYAQFYANQTKWWY